MTQYCWWWCGDRDNNNKNVYDKDNADYGGKNGGVDVMIMPFFLCQMDQPLWKLASLSVWQTHHSLFLPKVNLVNVAMLWTKTETDTGEHSDTHKHKPVSEILKP